MKDCPAAVSILKYSLSLSAHVSKTVNDLLFHRPLGLPRFWSYTAGHHLWTW